jgi:hypothetical protein
MNELGYRTSSRYGYELNERDSIPGRERYYFTSHPFRHRLNLILRSYGDKRYRGGLPISPNIKLVFYFQILLLRKEGSPYFRVLKNKYEDDY